MLEENLKINIGKNLNIIKFAIFFFYYLLETNKMSYSDYKNFELIKQNKDINNLQTNLFINNKLLTEQNYSEDIDIYFDNLISTGKLDITINNLLKNYVIYYEDNFKHTIVKNNMIDIDFSYYSSELMKEYMFVCDFLSEYYRNLAELKKEKFNIDNVSLYDYEFKIKLRYIYKRDKFIINTYNDDETTSYEIRFKFKTDKDTKNLDELIQPELDNIEILGEIESKYSDSVTELLKLIDNDFIKINTEKMDYYSLLAKSYNYKFSKLLLNYYISKTIYFYFKKKYETKVQEINDIIIVDFKIIFENFNNIINRATDTSFLKIIENTKQKKFEFDKEIKKNIDNYSKKIAQLILDRDKIIRDITTKYGDTDTPEVFENRLNEKVQPIDNKLEQLKRERNDLISNRYINREDARINEARELKNNLKNINKNIEYNTESMKKLDNELKSDKIYLNRVSLITYICSILLIILLVVLAIASVVGGNNINISIPITMIIISFILYIIIYNFINNKETVYNKIYTKPNLLNQLYNSFSLNNIEKFFDDTQNPEDIYELTNYEKLNIPETIFNNYDPIIKSIINDDNFGGIMLTEVTGDNVNRVQKLNLLIDDYINDKFDNDFSRKLYVEYIQHSSTVGNSAKKYLDIINATINTINADGNLSTDVFTIDGNGYTDLTYYNTTHNMLNNSQDNNSPPIIKNIIDGSNPSQTSEYRIVSFVNTGNDITTYRLKIPNTIKDEPHEQVDVLVLGGGSFGGHISARENIIDDDSVKSGEGGAGGACIIGTMTLLPGHEYEIGVGRGGIWNDDESLLDAIDNGQAKCSYIKDITQEKYYYIAQGATYIDYSNEADRYPVQLSGGKKELKRSTDLEDHTVSLNDITYNYQIHSNVGMINNDSNTSNGGIGGIVKPNENQFFYLKLDLSDGSTPSPTYYLSSATTTNLIDVNSDELLGYANGNPGYDISGSAFKDILYINNSRVAAGGGSASWCGDNPSVNGGGLFKLYNGATQNEEEVYYTCVDDNNSGLGGDGGGGNGNNTGDGIGENGTPHTGSGGGGGRKKGGNGGSGLVLIKFNFTTFNKKINDSNRDLKTNLRESLLHIIALKNQYDLEVKKEDLNKISTEIQEDKKEILAKYDQLGLNLSGITNMESNIANQNISLTTWETTINKIKDEIVIFQGQIQALQSDVTSVEGTKSFNEERIKELRDNIVEQQKNLGILEDNNRKKEETIRQKALTRSNAKQELIDKIVVNLEAEACKNIFQVADIEKKRLLAAAQAEKSKIYSDLVAGLDQQKLAAQEALIASENALESALIDQKNIEEEVEEKKREYEQLQEDNALEEWEKSYIISIKLAIDYRIAGILRDINENQLNTLTESQRLILTEELDQAREKKKNFKNTIINEITSSINPLDGNNVFSSRFHIIRIYSGNLIEIESENTDEQANREIALGLRRSSFANSEEQDTFANFTVTEHFQEYDYTRIPVGSYVAPDDITIIDLEIFAHPNTISSQKPWAREILQEIITQLEDTSLPLRNSRYLRFAREYKTTYKDGITDEESSSEWNTLPKEDKIVSDSLLLQANIDTIGIIKSNFSEINRLNIDDETYYDNVNPHVKNEYIKYSNYENNTNLLKKLMDSSNNIKVYDIRLKETIANFIITVCLLLSFYILTLKFMYNFIILFIFIIIILVLSLFFIIEMYEIVHTKSNKNYWAKEKDN